MTSYISRNPNSSHQPSCLVFFSLKKKKTNPNQRVYTHCGFL
ncbi:hypothetical protein NC652_006537 [Populus alba x Populus x berolinensis]|uniref:Uncharacterized protein n=1 Tax=Populus alba x Populus x berolinensis TaxID=444605 RepID=A0AAD6RER3_9ROSI|nr:hypothetical protein NC652_006537 [Populus alba x Populus x berolinensis]KAJ7007429.1 hypothetical protein NC653_006458 [Populus alba x Populus x berolinensis]